MNSADMLQLVEMSKALNSKLFSLPRLLILLALKDLGEDGAAFRELKANLGMGDGLLYANLMYLNKSGYVAKKTAKVEAKNLEVFSITPEGLAAILKLRGWLTDWIKATGGVE